MGTRTPKRFHNNKHSIRIFWIVFFKFKSKEVDSLRGFKAWFCLILCCSRNKTLRVLVKVVSPRSVVLAMPRVVWQVIAISGLLLLFVGPEQYQDRIFLFLPCGRNRRCDPHCSYKRQKPELIVRLTEPVSSPVANWFCPLRLPAPALLLRDRPGLRGREERQQRGRTAPYPREPPWSPRPAGSTGQLPLVSPPLRRARGLREECCLHTVPAALRFIACLTDAGLRGNVQQSACPHKQRGRCVGYRW